MDTFRQVSSEEAKLIALSFIGQNIGSLKEIDKNIVDGSTTLRSNKIDVTGVLKSISPNQPALLEQPQQALAPVQQPQVVIPNTQSLPSLDKVIEKLDQIIDLLKK